MQWVEQLAEAWPYFAGALTLFVSAMAAGHAILNKRDTRSATLWVGFTLFAPLVGAILYYLLGINRIKREAILLRGNPNRVRAPVSVEPCLPDQLEAALPREAAHLAALSRAASTFLKSPLLPGNCIEPLINGGAAYPAMLEAINQSRHSVTLCTYIFDRDEAGLAFASALGQAVARGVQVRVLLDATGARYSWPSICGALRANKVPYARFLPTLRPWGLLSMNLRNHRKLLVVDGSLGFTGGMNIRVGHWLEKNPGHPVRDLHCRVEGPVVAHLQEAFADDWFFTTRESLSGERWFPHLAPCGPGFARGIADGPEEDFDELRWTILTALSVAKRSVRVATPYFLPEPTIIAALNLAAMRGVTVDILLPAKSNLPFVHWASVAHWWQVLERGCRIWLSPPPFDHSKVFVVDDCWSLIGSTNWDPRSLRLNFEFNVESYDPALAATLAHWFDDQLALSRQTSLKAVDSRALPIRLRDGIARLFTPYL